MENFIKHYNRLLAPFHFLNFCPNDLLQGAHDDSAASGVSLKDTFMEGSPSLGCPLPLE